MGLGRDRGTSMEEQRYRHHDTRGPMIIRTILIIHLSLIVSGILLNEVRGGDPVSSGDSSEVDPDIAVPVKVFSFETEDDLDFDGRTRRLDASERGRFPGIRECPDRSASGVQQPAKPAIRSERGACGPTIRTEYRSIERFPISYGLGCDARI